MGKTAEKITIREMTAADTAGMAKVEEDVFTSPWTAKMFVEEFDNPLTRYLVLEHKGEVAGFAGFWLIAGEAQATNIAVLHKHQGKGWGQELVNRLMALAAENGADSFILEVRKSNLGARNLYEKLGLEIVGERRHYYMDNGEDALLMAKELKEDNHG